MTVFYCAIEQRQLFTLVLSGYLGSIDTVFRCSDPDSTRGSPCSIFGRARCSIPVWVCGGWGAQRRHSSMFLLIATLTLLCQGKRLTPHFATVLQYLTREQVVALARRAKSCIVCWTLPHSGAHYLNPGNRLRERWLLWIWMGTFTSYSCS